MVFHNPTRSWLLPFRIAWKVKESRKTMETIENLCSSQSEPGSTCRGPAASASACLLSNAASVATAHRPPWRLSWDPNLRRVHSNMWNWHSLNGHFRNRLIGGTIYTAYFWGLNFREYLHMILKFPLILQIIGLLKRKKNKLQRQRRVLNWCGYGSIPINTIFRRMNIHLPAILMFPRGTRFWHTAICFLLGDPPSPRPLFRNIVGCATQAFKVG